MAAFSTHSNIVRRAIPCLFQSTVKCFTTIKSIQMDSETFGSDDENQPPIIIMHGLLGSKRNWRGVAKRLESKLRRQIITVDARNHGDSPHVDEQWWEHMVEDVAAFMRNRGFAKACMLGHSMGGRVMMFFALKYPEMVDRAIICDISPIWLPRDVIAMNDLFDSMLKVRIPSDLPMSRGRSMAETQLLSDSVNKGMVDFILLNLRKHPDTGEYYWAANIKALKRKFANFDQFYEYIREFPSYNGPVMFVCGKYSSFMRTADWPDIRRIFPNSELHWLEAGHLVHFEQPLQFVDLVVKFVEQ